MIVKKSRFGFIATFFICFIFLTGCGNGNDEALEGNEATRTVSTLKGEVEIPADPQRIVDVSGSSEALLILGHVPVATADGDGYATDQLPNYLEGKMDDAVIVGYNMQDTMDLEAILAADPDVILMSERQEKIYDQLAAIAPVVMMENFDNEWRDRLMFIGELFEQEGEAKQWLADYDSKAERIGAEIIAQNGEQTYLSILTSGDSFFVFVDAGIGSILYDDLGLAKPENLPEQDGVSLPVVTIEGLSKIDADHIIVVATDEDKKNLESNAVWQSMGAVQEGNVTFLNSSPTFSQSYQPIGKEILLDTLKEELTR